jgi:hypothetical protein
MASARSEIRAGSGEGGCLPAPSGILELVIRQSQRKEAPMERYIGLDVHTRMRALTAHPRSSERASRSRSPFARSGPSLPLRSAVVQVPASRSIAGARAKPANWRQDRGRVEHAPESGSAGFSAKDSQPPGSSPLFRGVLGRAPCERVTGEPWERTVDARPPPVSSVGQWDGALCRECESRANGLFVLPPRAATCRERPQPPESQ